MTTVRFDQAGDRCTVEAKGHAVGDPVVCGIISAVLQGLATTLRNADEIGFEAEELHTKLESGDAQISCRGGDAVEALFSQTYVTLKQVELSKPDVINVIPPP